MAGRSGMLLIVAAAALTACGGDRSGERPCVVDTAKMASILDRDDAIAAPQDNRLDCIYASQGQALIQLGVRTREQFEAERARFESAGVQLPVLRPVPGFGDGATVDPRYNSLNVPTGDLIVSVQVLSPEPTSFDEQIALEKRVARAALDAL
jgi:hypothetical protein